MNRFHDDRLNAEKGGGDTLISAHCDNSVVCLRKYPDKSLGIFRDDEVLGIWTWADRQECIQTFVHLFAEEVNLPASFLECHALA